ncbi:MAG: hypothetical protein SGJ01_11770 [Gemmatimonadota bacterium]|nr:hypothetical protein [Gemmatimonadota bacterium]
MHPQRVSFIHTAIDGSLAFAIWDDTPMIGDFTRAVAGGGVTFDCQNGFGSTGNCGGATTVRLTCAAPTVAVLP